MGEWNPYSVPIYRNMAIFIELADIAVIFLFESYKNVLKRGYYIELVSSIKQAVMLIPVSYTHLDVYKRQRQYKPDQRGS